MTIALYTHQDMLDHRPGARHPERPERLQAVTDALSDASESSDADAWRSTVMTRPSGSTTQ